MRKVDSEMFQTSGLLHHFNSTVFWPWGLTLVVAQFEKDPEGETFRRVWESACRDAGVDPVPLEPLRVAISGRIRREWLPGLALCMTDPAEPIGSALSEAEQAVRRRDAEEWLLSRLEAIRAHKGDEW